MAITSYNPAFVGTYAIGIYLYGLMKISDLNEDYREPIEEYAATNFSNEEILTSLNNGWITQQEYDDTMSYKTT